MTEKNNAQSIFLQKSSPTAVKDEMSRESIEGLGKGWFRSRLVSERMRKPVIMDIQSVRSHDFPSASSTNRHGNFYKSLIEDNYRD